MIYTIKDGDFSAKIESKGANLISLMKGNVEYIWQRDEKYWGGSAPILFPVVGRCVDDSISVDGKVYHMPKHGIARIAEHTVVSQSEGEITFRFSSTPETKEMYPWDFEFDTTFALKDGVLSTSFKIHNSDNSDMYFSIGGHPAFNVPLDSDEKFEDWQVEFEQDGPLNANIITPELMISAKTAPVELEGKILPLKRGLFNADAIIVDKIESKSVKLVSSKSGKGVKVSYDGFHTLGIWTFGEPSDAPFVCIEPWTGMGMRDDENTIELKDRYDMQKLSAGDTYDVGFDIEVLK